MCFLGVVVLALVHVLYLKHASIKTHTIKGKYNTFKNHYQTQTYQTQTYQTQTYQTQTYQTQTYQTQTYQNPIYKRRIKV